MTRSATICTLEDYYHVVDILPGDSIHLYHDDRWVIGCVQQDNGMFEVFFLDGDTTVLTPNTLVKYVQTFNTKGA